MILTIAFTATAFILALVVMEPIDELELIESVVIGLLVALVAFILSFALFVGMTQIVGAAQYSCADSAEIVLKRKAIEINHDDYYCIADNSMGYTVCKIPVNETYVLYDDERPRIEHWKVSGFKRASQYIYEIPYGDYYRLYIPHGTQFILKG